MSPYSSRSTPMSDGWSQPAWRVRVRGSTADPMYLWGSRGLVRNITFSRPVLLHVHNDAFGEQVTVGTRQVDGSEDVIGTLQPGEAVSIPMHELSGVFATCELESCVWCLIKYTD